MATAPSPEAYVINPQLAVVDEIRGPTVVRVVVVVLPPGGGQAVEAFGLGTRGVTQNWLGHSRLESTLRSAGDLVGRQVARYLADRTRGAG